MNLFTHVREILIDILHDLSTQGILPADTDFSQATVEPPKDSSWGHGHERCDGSFKVSRN